MTHICCHMSGDGREGESDLYDTVFHIHSSVISEVKSLKRYENCLNKGKRKGREV